MIKKLIFGTVLTLFALFVRADYWADDREISFDSRERIVINSPDDVLRIAYSTNNWGKVDGGAYVRVDVNDDPLVITNVNGYCDWSPDFGAYGPYVLSQTWMDALQTPLASTNTTIYYGADYQLVYDEDKFIFVKRNADDVYGMGNLEDVTSYSIIHLEASPEYTNVDRYEFAGWKVSAYAERDIGWKTAVEDPSLLANFGDPYAVSTIFEMPFTNVFISCDYQWKSNYTEMVEVGAGLYNAWEIHEGETYPAGITTVAGSIVSLRGTVEPGQVVLNAGATNIWDFTNGGRPCFNNGGTIVDNGGTLLILVPTVFESGTYVIVTDVLGAEGTMFTITDGSESKEGVVGADGWIYVGAMRYRLRMQGSDIVLAAEWGIRQSIVIASSFAANPPFQDYDSEAGTFKWNGQCWTNGVNAFTSFTALFTNEMYAAGATNIHVFGLQTIASEPSMDNAWTLDLVTVTSDGGEAIPAIVSVNSAMTDPFELINITNKLAKIKGQGKIILAKTDVPTSIYDDFIDERPIIDDIIVVNTGVEPVKNLLTNNIQVDVDDQAGGETTEEGEIAVVLPGVETLDGGIDITVFSSATNDVIVAGKLEAPNGDISIANDSTNKLVLAGKVHGQYVNIYNRRKTETVEGVLEAVSIIADDNVIINNRAHLEANIVAGGKIDIINGSADTLVGSYRGNFVEIWGVSDGSISNVTFISDTRVIMGGNNILTGPLAIEAPTGAITNSGSLAWNVAKNNTMPCLADFDAIVHLEFASFGILIDGEQATGGTCNTYTLAKNARMASGRTFTVTGPSGFNETMTVGAGMRMVGDKIFELSVNANDELVFSVAPSLFAIKCRVVTIGSKWISGGRASVASAAVVGTTVSVTATPNSNWQFNGWSGTNIATGAEIVFANALSPKTTFTMVASDVDLVATFALSEVYRAESQRVAFNDCVAAADKLEAMKTLLTDEEFAIFSNRFVIVADTARERIASALVPTDITRALSGLESELSHLLEAATWTYDGRVRFEAKYLSVTEGKAIDVRIFGGSSVNSSAAELSLSKNLAGTVKAYDANGKRVRLPLTINWKKGDTSAKVYRFLVARKNNELDRFFTLQLAKPAACAIGENPVCTIEVLDVSPEAPRDERYVYGLAWPADGGKITGSGDLKRNGTRTLKASVRKYSQWKKYCGDSNYAVKDQTVFAGWYHSRPDNPSMIDLTNPVEGGSSEKLTVTEAGTYYAYFTNVLKLASVVDPDWLSAEGIRVTNDVATAFVGMNVMFPIKYHAADGTTASLRVRKLPRGLKFDRDTGIVSGVPTKEGSFTVEARAQNMVGKHIITFVIEVKPMKYKGEFAGELLDSDVTVGTIELKAKDNGKASAKVNYAGRNLTLNADGWNLGTDDSLWLVLSKQSGEMIVLRTTLVDGKRILTGGAFGGEFGARIIQVSLQER